ncbi:hypothetical protein C4D60_Mb02t10400 [Musa balbisiana]|uniref:Uncharacterized protein n=1 Tax=Musa balbisiana TaxID=52838 RepID=A0A4S8I9P1_MUSBA|nr:hypothetical protein C4D60_Mb02t10400 [Musa balbisiana]
MIWRVKSASQTCAAAEFEQHGLQEKLERKRTGLVSGSIQTKSKLARSLALPPSLPPWASNPPPAMT